MIDRDPLLHRQMQEIGDRYLLRTLSDVSRLRQLIRAAGPCATRTLAEIQHLVHKMHGSGAIFGFDAITEAAGCLERLVEPYLADGCREPDVLIAQAESLIERLVVEADSAARSRGLL